MGRKHSNADGFVFQDGNGEVGSELEREEFECREVASSAPPDREASPGDDEWDLNSLRVSQEFAEGLGVEQVVSDCPVKKPDKAAWIRTHPEPGFSIETLILELREERELFLVSPRLHSQLITEPTVSRQLLVTSITRQGRLFLWPIKLPGPDGRSNPWNDTAADAARRARTRWVRIAADMSYGSYRVWEASGDLGEPKWPKLSFQEILRLAFQDRFIREMDHPIVRRLRDGS